MADRPSPAPQILEIWLKFRPVILGRVDVLETAATNAADAGFLEPSQRRAAHREAHKLAGSLGTFGFAEGSLRAREIELLLEGEKELPGRDIRRLAELVAELRNELEPQPSVKDRQESKEA